MTKLQIKKKRRSFFLYLIAAILFSVLGSVAGHVLGSKEKAANTVPRVILPGAQTMNEEQLRALVVAKGLMVYWLGPRTGATYVLNTSLVNGISLRTISDSASSNTIQTYYEIGTFISPNAFTLTQKAATQPNGVGFINADGNAIYYDARDPNNVYIGLKNADVQVEIFDPRPGQALAAALLQGNIQKIS